MRGETVETKRQEFTQNHFNQFVLMSHETQVKFHAATRAARITL